MKQKYLYLSYFFVAVSLFMSFELWSGGMSSGGTQQKGEAGTNLFEDLGKFFESLEDSNKQDPDPKKAQTPTQTPEPSKAQSDNKNKADPITNKDANHTNEMVARLKKINLSSGNPRDDLSYKDYIKRVGATERILNRQGNLLLTIATIKDEAIEEYRLWHLKKVNASSKAEKPPYTTLDVEKFSGFQAHHDSFETLQPKIDGKRWFQFIRVSNPPKKANRMDASQIALSDNGDLIAFAFHNKARTHIDVAIYTTNNNELIQNFSLPIGPNAKFFDNASSKGAKTIGSYVLACGIAFVPGTKDVAICHKDMNYDIAKNHKGNDVTAEEVTIYPFKVSTQTKKNPEQSFSYHVEPFRVSIFDSQDGTIKKQSPLMSVSGGYYYQYRHKIFPHISMIGPMKFSIPHQKSANNGDYFLTIEAAFYCRESMRLGSTEVKGISEREYHGIYGLIDWPTQHCPYAGTYPLHFYNFAIERPKKSQALLTPESLKLKLDFQEQKYIDFLYRTTESELGKRLPFPPEFKTRSQRGEYQKEYARAFEDILNKEKKFLPKNVTSPYRFGRTELITKKVSRQEGPPYDSEYTLHLQYTDWDYKKTISPDYIDANGHNLAYEYKYNIEENKNTYRYPIIMFDDNKIPGETFTAILLPIPKNLQQINTKFHLYLEVDAGNHDQKKIPVYLLKDVKRDSREAISYPMNHKLFYTDQGLILNYDSNFFLISYDNFITLWKNEAINLMKAKELLSKGFEDKASDIMYEIYTNDQSAFNLGVSPHFTKRSIRNQILCPQYCGYNFDKSVPKQSLVKLFARISLHDIKKYSQLPNGESPEDKNARLKKLIQSYYDYALVSSYSRQTVATKQALDKIKILSQQIDDSYAEHKVWLSNSKQLEKLLEANHIAESNLDKAYDFLLENDINSYILKATNENVSAGFYEAASFLKKDPKKFCYLFGFDDEKSGLDCSKVVKIYSSQQYDYLDLEGNEIKAAMLPKQNIQTSPSQTKENLNTSSDKKNSPAIEVLD